MRSEDGDALELNGLTPSWLQGHIEGVSSKIRFRRTWAMSNASTFTILPIRELLERYLLPNTDKVIVDPFVGASPYKLMCISNDLNPDIMADSHKDAIDFLKHFEDSSVDTLLFDPPYSVRQVAECYKGVGMEVTNETTRVDFYSRIKNEITRIIKPNGIVISFGWTTMGIGKGRGFHIEEILIVPYGGSKNDTLVTVERKHQTNLDILKLKDGEKSAH